MTIKRQDDLLEEDRKRDDTRERRTSRLNTCSSVLFARQKMSNRRDSTALVSMQARRFKKQSYDCELLSSPATTRYSIFAYSHIRSSQFCNRNISCLRRATLTLNEDTPRALIIPGVVLRSSSRLCSAYALTVRKSANRGTARRCRAVHDNRLTTITRVIEREENDR